MATESQFDIWRKSITSNLRKAGDAAIDRANGEYGEGQMVPSDRIQIALAAGQMAAETMTAERVGQLVSILTTSGDERFQEMADRIRTGEQILGRIVETAEKSDLELDDEVMVSITMAEDWLNPEGVVGFATPESVEKGTDAQSQEFADVVPPEDDLEEADAAEVAEFDEMAEEEPFDRAEEDMKEDE